MARRFSYIILGMAVALASTVEAQEYSAENLTSLKTFYVSIDMPENVKCGLKKKFVKNALNSNLEHSGIRIVGGNHTTDGGLVLKVNVNEDCSGMDMNLQVVTNVTIDRTSRQVYRIPIWQSGSIRFETSRAANWLNNFQSLTRKLVSDWQSVNH
jgi:hypothetical protein